MERLEPQPWMTTPGVRAVIDALEAAGRKGCARFVGGCVRDTLLGRADQVTDVDIATPLTPPEVIAALKAAGLKAVPTGIEHGTVTAISDGKPYEITTLRRDVETDGRRAVVAFTTSWEEDAQRRDFRLNALYADPDGTIHDPTGGGLADVAARRIVFVGDPETRIREDYLRILRFFRFLARVGDAAEADPAGLAACEKLKNGIAGLSGERIQQEMFKLLGAPNPLSAVRLMAEGGVLAEVLPDAGELWSIGELVSQDDPLGASDSVLRLAALLPDRSEAMASAAARLRLSNAVADRLLATCSAAALPLAFDMDGAAVRRTVFAIGQQAFEDRLRLAAADSDRRPDVWLERLKLARSWSPPPFPVTGAEIKALGVPEGPLVGVIRKALEDWWIDGDFSAIKAEALERLEVIVRDLSLPPPEGYSGKPLAQKLGVKPGDRVSVIDPPSTYAALVALLPEGAVIVPAKAGEGEAGAVVHAFARDRAGLQALAPVLALWPPLGAMIWISWPKKTSPLFRDLTEDGVREFMLPTGWVDVKVAAVDADWSGLKFLRRRVG